MAPKSKYQVASLNKHIEETNKGLSAGAQFNRRPAQHKATAIKKEPGSFEQNVFGDNESDDGSSSSDSGSDSDSEDDGSKFLRRLTSPGSSAPAGSKKTPKHEVEDSDVERKASAGKRKPAEKNTDSSSDGPGSEPSDARTRGNDVTGPEAEAASTTSSEGDSGSGSGSGSESSENSSDGGSDSESEEESEGGTASEPKVKPTVNGTTAHTDTSSSEEEDESSDGESEDESDAGEGVKLPEATAKETETTSPPSSTSDSDESDDSEESDEQMVDESMHIADRDGAQQGPIPNFIAPDFALRKGDDGSNGQDVAEICSQANLQGKQFWYFTVPSNVPVSVVQNLEIPMDQSQRGGRVFSHGGEDYGVSFDNMVPKSNIQILIPSADGPQYQAAPQQIDQVMQVRRITQLGTPSTSSSVAGPAPKNAPRPQPKGLKARYQPIGVNNSMGKIGVDASSESDEDAETAEAPALQAPVATPDQKLSKKEKRRLQKEAADSTPAEKTKGKKKAKKADDDTPESASQPTTGSTATSDTRRKGKRKHTSSEDDAAAVVDQLMEESMSAKNKSKKQKTDRKGSPDLGSGPTSSATKKQTPIPPPTAQAPSSSLPGLGSADAASTPPATTQSPPAADKAKKSKKSKPETPAPAPASGRKETPIPVPRQSQTAVPLPFIPSSSASKPSPVPVPQPPGAASSKEDKKAKKRKDKADKKAAAPSSSLPSEPASGKKVTHVPPPSLPGSS